MLVFGQGAAFHDGLGVLSPEGVIESLDLSSESFLGSRVRGGQDHGFPGGVSEQACFFGHHVLFGAGVGDSVENEDRGVPLGEWA